jgi:dihydroorotate dehydrogenase
MVNCLAATVTHRGKLLFSGERRGIAGSAIRDAAVQQIRLFKQLVDQLQSPIELVGVGGIRSTDDVQRHLDAGATGVQVATSAMLGNAAPVVKRRG